VQKRGYGEHCVAQAQGTYVSVFLIAIVLNYAHELAHKRLLMLIVKLAKVAVPAAILFAQAGPKSSSCKPIV
jgi:hypothetical protein